MSDSSKLVWKNMSFMKSRQLYSQLVNTLISDIGFAKAICECVDSTEVDALAQILVLLFNKANRALALIKALLASEFQKTTEASKGSVMRGNNIVSKLEGAYVRIIGADYLKKVVRQLVEDLLNSADSFEIDPNKLFPVSYTEDTEHQSVLARNRQNLLEYSQICLDRITDPELIEEMPRPIRAIAGYTAEYANKYFPDSIYPLIGGFLMLRYFGPGMVTPEAWGILAPDVVPNPEARRNLVLLTKLLQNASNNVLFTSKEEYMTCMNSFITSNKEKMQHYFSEVATDPIHNDEPWKDMEAISFNSIEIDTIDLADLFELHRIIEGCSQKLIPYLQKNADPEDAKTIIELIQSLGSPPKKTKRQIKKDSKSENGENDTDGPAGPTDSKLMDLTTLERAKFLYPGPPNKSGHAVFYLIVQRMKPEFLKNENQLIQYIFKTMDSAVNAGPYSIVIDMSWASISNEMKKTVYTQTQKILKILSRNYRKNIAFIYIVHPNVFTRTLLYFIRPFTSRKFQKKIIEIYNWKSLKDYIEADKIALPESSRDYITKSYYVTKVNSKGKKQERLIKFTLNSLLNIDPKSHKIQNEKFLSEISEITSSVNSLELTMSFNPSVESQIKQRRKAKGFGFSDSDDMLSRRYVCKSIQDRDDIIEDIFRCCYLLKDESSSLPQEYRVTKINRVGKHQERLFKLTIDSLLNINDHKILNEMSFSGIEQVTLDPKDKDLVTLKYKAENTTRKIICKGFAHLLYKCLEESVERFRRNDVHSEDSEKRDIDELHVEGSEEVKRKNGLSVSKSN